MCGFCAVQDQEDQPSSPDCLLMDDVSAGILIDFDGCISSSSSGMWSKKVSKSFFHTLDCIVIAIAVWKGRRCFALGLSHMLSPRLGE